MNRLISYQWCRITFKFAHRLTIPVEIIGVFMTRSRIVVSSHPVIVTMFFYLRELLVIKLWLGK